MGGRVGVVWEGGGGKGGWKWYGREGVIWEGRSESLIHMVLGAMVLAPYFNKVGG